MFVLTIEHLTQRLLRESGFVQVEVILCVVPVSTVVYLLSLQTKGKRSPLDLALLRPPGYQNPLSLCLFYYLGSTDTP